MCCLGFFAKACGFRNDEITEIATPRGARDALGKWPSWVVEGTLIGWGENSDAIEEIIGVNDEDGLTMSEREKRLTKLFAKQGVRVTFKD